MPEKTTATQKTVEASFKGIPFYVETETQEGGRKVAIHEYPGSDNRFVQDLGLEPGIFRVRGYVADAPPKTVAIAPSVTIIGGWQQADQDLTNAFEKEEEGLLVLSTFGSVRVKAHRFSKTQDQKELGIIRYNMTFLVTTPNPSPVKAPSSEFTVAAKASAVLEVVETDMSELWITPTEATEVFVGEYDGGQVADSLADGISGLGQNLDGVTKYATNIRTNISDFVRDPIAFASAMFNDGLLGAIFDTVAASRDTVNALSELCRVGYNLGNDFQTIKDDALSNAIKSFDIPKFADDAKYRITSNKNRVTITNNTRIAVFAIYMKDAVKIDYTTDSEINAVISDINDVYENVITISDVEPIVALTLDECRIDALKVLEAKLLTTPNVETYTLNVPTVDIELAYRLYAEEFNTVDGLVLTSGVLTDLNDILPSRFKGDVEVLRL